MFTRRRFLLAGALLLVAVSLLACLPTAHLVKTWLGDKNEIASPPPGFVDDASRLNQTAVAELWSIPGNLQEAESQLRELLLRAREQRLPVAIAGSKHTMGGHTISPQGIVVNMLPFCSMRLDEDAKVLHVGAGARWDQVLPFLDKHGYSVAVMQSNNSFSVGGSISANCHGWQHNSPPIASTVAGFRLMTADGAVRRCSRDENTELFRLVLGGYGLFGVILEVDLRVVPNERYRMETHITPADRYVAVFEEEVNKKGAAGMVYGRLCIVPGEEFLREAILAVFRKDGGPKDKIPALSEPGLAELKRTIFRGSVGSDYGKRLRWKSEKLLGAEVKGKHYSRNQLFNEGVELFQEHSAKRTDILHEYFIPPERFADFLAHMRAVIPKHQGDLLNVTVRNVLKDEDAFLTYADRDMFGFVMLFSQERTSEADARMEAMTRKMIDVALDLGGRYYLPYRLHATRAQFYRAYPQAAAFFELKRRYDPDGIFQNMLFQKYGTEAP